MGDTVDYLKEINAFYDWLETNPLSDSAIALWYALMHTNNRAGWKTEFAVATSTIEAKSGLRKDAIIRSRHRLQQLGRIEFKPRSGNQSTIYKIIPFNNFVVLNDANRDTNRAQTATQDEHKPPPFKGLSKQDLNTVTVITPVGGIPENSEPLTMAEAHRKVFGILMMPSIHSDFLLPIMKLHGESYVVEMLLEMGEVATKPSIRYLEKVHAGWQKDGITSREQAKEKKEADNGAWENQQRQSSARRGSSQSRGQRKPSLPVVGNDGPAPVVSAEERERMRELARKLRDGGPELSVQGSTT